MKYAVTVVAVLLVTGVAATAQDVTQAPSPGGGSVSVAVTTADVRQGFSTRTDILLLWNRNERSRPIGHAIKACIKAGAGGILGQGVMSCSLNIQLPLGKVTAAGIVHDLRRYTLVITGGTGAYRGVSGPLFVRSVSGNGVRRLTFEL